MNPRKEFNQVKLWRLIPAISVLIGSGHASDDATIQDEWKKQVRKACPVWQYNPKTPEELVCSLFQRYPPGTGKGAEGTPFDSYFTREISRHFPAWEVKETGYSSFQKQAHLREVEDILYDCFHLSSDDTAPKKFSVGRFSRKSREVLVNLGACNFDFNMAFMFDSLPGRWKIADIRYTKGYRLSEIGAGNRVDGTENPNMVRSYSTMKTEFISKFKRTYDINRCATEMEDHQAVQALEIQLRRIIGRLSEGVDGSPGETNTYHLLEQPDGGGLDGLHFHGNGKSVFITTIQLIEYYSGWLRVRGVDFSAPSLDSITASAWVANWEPASASTVTFGEINVRVPESLISGHAFLAKQTIEIEYEPPSGVMVTARKGNRVFLAWDEFDFPQIPACKSKMGAYNEDPRPYVDCYARHAPKAEFHSKARAKAQDLLNWIATIR